MKRTIRRLAVLGTAVATATAAHAGPIPLKKLHDTTALSSSSVPLLLAAGEAGEAGEGGLSSDDDMAFHVGIGEIEGKLTVGFALHAQGDIEGAKGHMVRPSDDIYAGLKPILAERNAPGFETELTALADAADAGAPADEVQAKLQAAIAAIDENGAPETAKELALTVVRLVRNAGGDYASGVADGKVVDAHEYQDAWGYVQAAKRMIGAAADHMKDEYGAQFEKISGYLNGLDKAWPDISGKSGVETDASLLAGAAARIELVALQMD